MVSGYNYVAMYNNYNNNLNRQVLGVLTPRILRYVTRPLLPFLLLRVASLTSHAPQRSASEYSPPTRHMVRFAIVIARLRGKKWTHFRISSGDGVNLDTNGAQKHPYHTCHRHSDEPCVVARPVYVLRALFSACRLGYHSSI